MPVKDENLMKVVILAGGYGTRISEESHLRPKPMIEIGGKPILWHIMSYYSHFGFNEFVICLGYKGHIIKEYFANYHLHHSDITFDFSNEGSLTVHKHITEPWKVTLVDTGKDVQTGGRIKRVANYLDLNESFLLTYGDGVSDVDLNKLIKTHKQSDNILTLTTIQPAGRFGVLDIDESGNINAFREKAVEDVTWINGGYMIAQPELLDYIAGDSEALEVNPLSKLAKIGKLGAYKHHGFWACMDTQRDKHNLEELYKNNTAKWKVW